MKIAKRIAFLLLGLTVALSGCSVPAPARLGGRMFVENAGVDTAGNGVVLSLNGFLPDLDDKNAFLTQPGASISGAMEALALRTGRHPYLPHNGALIVGRDFREGIFILPVVLGMLCTMLMYNENQYDMLKQLWIVPVNKMAYFFSKFAVVLVYSVCFMLITAAASILTGVLPGYIAFDSGSVLYLLRKCMEISLLTAFAVLPILAAAAAQKGYILPVCLTLVYTFLGFILLMVNMYLHPLSSMTAIVMRDIPGVVITQPLNIPGAFLCIGVWGVASVLLAGAALKKRK